MQLDIFSQYMPLYKLTKPIRLIELFAGIGSQAKALERLGVEFEHYRIVEFDKYAVASYNVIHGTNFETQDITKISAKDLGIEDIGKYDYIMTYSFPCQDLSLAGNQKGMKKGSATRSGLLWEVERLLNECESLPQILLMENVPQVIGTSNIDDFYKWEAYLSKLGYSNYIKLMNAKNYGIPQNRNRCFMVSILGNFYYQFPCKKKLKLRLKDLLEDNVDEKYYLSDKMIEGMKNTNFESYKLENKLLDKNGIASTIIARFEGTPQCIKVAQLDGFESSGRVYSLDGLAPTINTMGGGQREPKIAEPICLNSKVNGKQPSLQDRVYDSNGISTAITTSFMPSILIPEDTKQGYTEAHVGDGVYIDRPCQKRGVVQKGMIQTIKTQPNDIGVVVENKVNRNNIKNINEEDGVFSTLGTNCGSSTSAGGGVVVVGEYRTDEGIRTFKDDVIGTLRTIDACGDKVVVTNSPLRIRKLTPKECWRLMGFSDEDFEKASKVNSNSQLYKQAGNSIVVNVLEEIFKMLF